MQASPRFDLAAYYEAQAVIDQAASDWSDTLLDRGGLDDTETDAAILGARLSEADRALRGRI